MTEWKGKAEFDRIHAERAAENEARYAHHRPKPEANHAIGIIIVAAAVIGFVIVLNAVGE